MSSNPATSSTTDYNNYPDAHVIKRLIAMVYDSFLALAVLMFASALSLVFTGGEAPAHSNIYMTLYLILVLFVFFAWFWMRGGQTLGMQAWRIKLVPRHHDGNISWQKATLRFASALPGWSLLILAIVLSFRAEGTTADSIVNRLPDMPVWIYYLIAIIWLVLDNIPNNWREKLTATRVIQLPKQAK